MTRRAGRFVSALALTAAAFAVPPAGHAAPAPTVQPCTRFAASRTFAVDKTAVCAGEHRDPSTGNTTGFAFFATTDAGRTWANKAAAGLVLTAGSNLLSDVFVSPRYASDSAVYVQLTTGLYVTLDLGGTFLPVDPLAWARLTPFVAGVAAPGSGEAAGHTLFAHARRGDVEGGNQSAIVDPTTRLRTPVKGSPGFDHEFLISPTFAADGIAYVVAEHGIGLTRHFRLYRCSVALECSTPLHRFPDRSTFDRAWLAPDHATSRIVYASITSVEGRRTLWWSRDGAKTFTAWWSVQRIQPDLSSVDFAISGVPGTRHVYLRITGNDVRKAGAAPYEQLFLSTDSGASWRRVSYGRAPGQPGARGSMPPAPPPGSRADGRTPRGIVTATGGGRVFVVGRTYDGMARYDSVWCTVDNGRTWARSCAR